MSEPRMCQRFYCDERGDRFCCADCGRSHLCLNPCLNDPGRCGLEDRTPAALRRARAKPPKDPEA